MNVQPIKLIKVRTTTVTVDATWNVDDGTSDPFINFPYRWSIVLTVTPQPTSSHTSRVPYVYNGQDIVVGDWFSNAVGGAAWKIISISSASAGSATVIVEDVDRFNTFNAAGQNGDGAPPNLTNGFIFTISSDDGLPILSPTITNIIDAQWQTDVLSRFRYRNATQSFFQVQQDGHTFAVGNLISVLPQNSSEDPPTYVLADGTKRVIGQVNSVNIPDQSFFTFKPYGKIIYGITLPGFIGGNVAINPSSAGDLVSSDTLPVVYIKLGDTTALAVNASYPNALTTKFKFLRSDGKWSNNLGADTTVDEGSLSIGTGNQGVTGKSFLLGNSNDSNVISGSMVIGDSNTGTFYYTQIRNISIDNPGTNLTDGTRTFTIDGGTPQSTPYTFTANVIDGSVVSVNSGTFRIYTDRPANPNNATPDTGTSDATFSFTEVITYTDITGVVFGSVNKASDSFVKGNANNVSNKSVIFGDNNLGNAIIGYGDYNSGASYFVKGSNNIAQNNSVIFGNTNINVDNSFIYGDNNNGATTLAFIMGNNNTTIANSFIQGNVNNNITNSFILGNNNDTISNGVIIGNSNNNGNFSLVFGNNNSSFYSITIGSGNIFENGIGFGNNNNMADGSFVIGNSNKGLVDHSIITTIFIDSPGTGLTDGLRTFTVVGGSGTAVATFTATVVGGTIDADQEITIVDAGSYDPNDLPADSQTPTVDTGTSNASFFLFFESVYGFGQGFVYGNSNTLTNSGIAFGASNIVSDKSIANGNTNTISSRASFASGFTNGISGDQSVALGNVNTVSGNQAFAQGNNNVSNGLQTWSVGGNNTVAGDTSFAFGNSNDVNGHTAFAFGNNNQVNTDADTTFVFGNLNASTAAGSVTIGDIGSDKGNINSFIHSGGFTSLIDGSYANGISQYERHVFSAAAQGTSATRITVTASTAAAGNVASLQNNSVGFFDAKCVARNTTSGAVYSWYLNNGVIIRGNGANTTTLVSGTFTAGPTSGSPPSASPPTVAADTTNGGFDFEWTPANTNTDIWMITLVLFMTVAGEYPTP